MTRINVIPPSELTDQHLLAELRELPRVFSLARQLDDDVIPTYRMGVGHVKFFYSRTGFLAKRHSLLIKEALGRGFDITYSKPYNPIPFLDHDWDPTDIDINVNKKRLREKLSLRVGWYRYKGTVVKGDFYG